MRRYRRTRRLGDAKDLSGTPFFWSQSSNVKRVCDAKKSSLSPEIRLFSRDSTKTFGSEEEYGIMSRHEMHNFNDIDEISAYENLISEDDASTIVIGDL